MSGDEVDRSAVGIAAEIGRAATPPARLDRDAGRQTGVRHVRRRRAAALGEGGGRP